MQKVLFIFIIMSIKIIDISAPTRANIIELLKKDETPENLKYICNTAPNEAPDAIPSVYGVARSFLKTA